MNDKALLIPIEVQALYLPDEQSAAPQNRLLSATADFSKLPFPDGKRLPYTSDKVVAEPFSNGTSQAGVHLHWLVPDALSVGTVDKSGDVTFEPVPNRWLVARLTTTPNSEPQLTKAWLVESDRVSLKRQHPLEQTSIPHNFTDPAWQPFAYLGQVFNFKVGDTQAESGFEDWSGECEAERAELTVIGFGESEFNAYYPNCRGVFGFRDKERLEPDVKRTYVVIGWHKDGEGDPLAAGMTAETIAAHKWELAQDAIISSTITRTLYHGAVVGVSTDSDDVEEAHLKDNVQIAIGNSTAEALSALIAKLARPDNPRALERQLNALQWNLIDAQATNELETYSHAAHQAGFWSNGASPEWSLRPDTEEREQLPPLPKEVLLDLNKLNQLQAAYYYEQEALAKRRWQLFSDSCKLQEVRYIDPGNEHDAFGKLSPLERQGGHVTDYLAKIAKNLEEHRSEYPEKIKQQKAQLQEKLNGLPIKYKLFENSGARYWLPTDPAIMIAGEIARPPARSDGDGRFSPNGSLRCRLNGDLRFPVGSELPWVQELSAAVKAANLPCPDEIVSIVVEASQIDRDDAESLQLLTDAQGERDDVAFLHPLAYQPYKKSWLPLLLDWRAALRPFKRIEPNATVDALQAMEYNKNWLTERFKIDGADLTHYGELQPETKTQNYQGKTILSTASRSSLAEQIRGLSGLTDNPELKEKLKQLADEFGDLPILSQQVEGFHETLLMRRHVLQLNMIDPSSRRRDPLYSGDKPLLERVVGAANTHSPQLDTLFNPIRASLLKLKRLRVVDAFGRFSDILPDDDVKLIIAEGLQPPETVNERNEHIFLAPRLPQASRLKLRWLPPLPACQKSARLVTSHTMHSPACGWFVDNVLDEGLMVYDEFGNALGSLIIGAEDTVLWRAAPLSGDADARLPVAIDKVNRSLKQCILALWNGGKEGSGRYLKKILNCLRASRVSVDAAYRRQANDPWFVGQRLMLARVELDLELQQLPALNQSWTELLATITKFKEGKDVDYSERLTSGFTGVEFPVRLGNRAYRDDGLVGYFINDNYATFYSSAADSTEDGVVNPDKLKDGQPIRLVADANPENIQRATFLFDPAAKVHATTGIHPVKAIDVPTSLYETIQRELQVTFLTAPLISQEIPKVGEATNLYEELALPLPSIASNRWSWVERNETGWHEIPRGKLGGVDEKESKSLYPLAIREGWLRLGAEPMGC